MAQQFNQNELGVLISLINRVNITGQEAMTVAILLQKINGMIQGEQVQPPMPTPTIEK